MRLYEKRRTILKKIIMEIWAKNRVSQDKMLQIFF